MDLKSRMKSANAATQKMMDELADDAKEVGIVLTSPGGKKLMDKLMDSFYDGDIIGPTPEITAFHLGAREVVRYMKSLRDTALESK